MFKIHRYTDSSSSQTFAGTTLHYITLGLLLPLDPLGTAYTVVPSIIIVRWHKFPTALFFGPAASPFNVDNGVVHIFSPAGNLIAEGRCSEQMDAKEVFMTNTHTKFVHVSFLGIFEHNEGSRGRLQMG